MGGAGCGERRGRLGVLMSAKVCLPVWAVEERGKEVRMREVKQG